LGRALGYLDGENTNQVWKANCYEMLVIIALEKGDDQAAQTNHEEAIRLRDKSKNRVHMAYSLEVAAEIASVRKQAERAARLLGAAESLRETISSPLPFPYQERYKRLAESVRAQLSEQTFDAEWAVGRGWTYEQAVQYAIYDRLP
jgi:hypothetical protein